MSAAPALHFKPIRPRYDHGTIKISNGTSLKLYRDNNGNNVILNTSDSKDDFPIESNFPMPHPGGPLTIETLNNMIETVPKKSLYVDQQSATLVDTYFSEAEADDGLLRALEHNRRGCPIMKEGRWYTLPPLPSCVQSVSSASSHSGDEDVQFEPISKWPELEPEMLLANWFNNVLSAVHTNRDQSEWDDLGRAPRLWSARSLSFATTPNSKNEQRLCGVLLSPALNGATSASWEDVSALFEIHPENDASLLDVNTLYSKALICFAEQPSRLSLPTLFFYNNAFKFIVFDRVGHVRSSTYDINKEPLVLLRILIGLSFSEGRDIGIDSLVKFKSNGDMKEIVQHSPADWKFLRSIVGTQVIRGRATHVWLVEHPTYGVCIMKDCWIEHSRKIREDQVLKKVKGRPGFPTLRAICPKRITTWLRKPNPSTDEGQCEYVNLRFSMDPVGMSIAHFSCRKELVGVFLDLLRAHKTLYEEFNLLHRNVSFSDMLAVKSANPNATNFDDRRKKGLLIGFSHTTEIGEDSSVDDYDRTGSPAFMSIALLDNRRVHHRAQHDLEAFFYVLLYACTKYDGPNKLVTEPRMIDDWFKPNQQFADLAKTKAYHFVVFGRLMDELSSFFRSFRETLQELFNEMIGPSLKCGSNLVGNTLLHDPIIKILQKLYDNLPETDVFESPSPDFGTFALSSRAIAQHDSKLSESGSSDAQQSPVAVRTSGFKSSVVILNPSTKRKDSPSNQETPRKVPKTIAARGR